MALRETPDLKVGGSTPFGLRIFFITKSFFAIICQMETFHSLISKITCSKSDSEMVLALNNFQRNISAEICKQNNQSSDILISEFVKIWNCFLNLPYRDRTNVKLALHSALSAFLFRLTPYFPEEIKMSFEMVSMNDTLDENSSILRISSFV